MWLDPENHEAFVRQLMQKIQSGELRQVEEGGCGV